VVGQFGTGTVSTTDVGQTSDGHMEGVSSLSITNGVVSTYSATLLDYTASLYYDSDTVATLFDEGAQIGQSTTPVNINTSAGLSANAIAWHDYDLQTDHYAIAYFLSGGYYENPFYWGNSCDAETGDCTVDSGGGYAYWITAASIYMGSTLADQGSVPQDGSLPPFDLNAYNGFLASSQPPYSDVPTFRAQVTEWIKRIGSVYPAIELVEGSNNPNKSLSVPPIPFYVDLISDVFDMGTAERQRTFIIKDLYGRPWNMNYPLSVRERFSSMSTGGRATAPQPDGIWYTLIPKPSPQAVEIDRSQFTDHHQGNPLNMTAQVNYLQYYYATDFTIPSYLSQMPNLFTIPGISSGPALPLWIKDTLNRCSTNSALPAEGINLNWTYVYIQGDGGPGTGCRAQ
jgi:hypothetical protein